MSNLNEETLADTLFLLLRKNDQSTRDLAKQILEIHEKALRVNSLVNQERYKFYLDVIKRILDSNITINDQASMESFLVKIKSMKVIQDDPEMFSSIRRIVTDQSTTSDSIDFTYKKLYRWVIIEKNNKLAKQLFGILNRNQDGTIQSQDSIINDVNSVLETALQFNMDSINKINGNADDNLAREADFDDPESLLKAFKVLKATTRTNRFVTGLQGLNRAMDGGIDLGESLVINSRAHNAKSLMLLKFARWIVTLNRVDSSFKNPACVFYSLENETPQNIKKLFEELWINEHQTVPPEDMDDQAIVTYCINKFQEHGWKFIIRRKVGAEFGFNELVMEFKELVRLGFTPLVCIIDYVNMMRKDGNDQTGNYLQVRQLYTNLCNFLKSNHCCLITAHQLNRKADEAVRLNPVGAVKKFSADMLADSTDPQREVDMVIYQNKEIDSQNRSWLTFKLDKHRYHETTPEKDKYFAYRFEGELGIMDDLGAKDRSTTNIYAVTDDEETEDFSSTPTFS